MKLLLCADPLSPHRVDDAYQSEFEAARQAGWDVSLINFEALTFGGDAAAAAGRVPIADSETLGIYRGWMLTVNQYTRLHSALRARGTVLINSPDAYAHCHYLPQSYDKIEVWTPKTVWVAQDKFDLSSLAALLAPFGARPIIVKDYVKSRKHEWAEACFIPSAADTLSAARVVETFMRRQGPDLAGGLVFREFVEFEPLTTHAQSGMPLTREFRLIFLDGEALSVSRYWEDGDYAGEQPPMEPLTALARTIESRFFTMDVARTVAGGWKVIELGDAQVAALPPETEPSEFYARLREAVSVLSRLRG